MNESDAMMYRDLGFIITAARSWGTLIANACGAWEKPPDLQMIEAFLSEVETTAARLQKAIEAKDDNGSQATE